MAILLFGWFYETSSTAFPTPVLLNAGFITNQFQFSCLSAVARIFWLLLLFFFFFYHIFNHFSLLQFGGKSMPCALVTSVLEMFHFHKSVSAGVVCAPQRPGTKWLKNVQGEIPYVCFCAQCACRCLLQMVCVCVFVRTCRVGFQTNSAAANYSDRKISLCLFSHQYTPPSSPPTVLLL